MLSKLAIVLFLFCCFVIGMAAFYQQTPMNSVSITNSQVNSTPVGNAAPSTGSFTGFNASGASSFGSNMTVTGSVTASGGFVGNASSASAVPWAGVSGKPPVTTWNWLWSGQGGQPSYLWGSNDGFNMYVWTPSNFSVNYSNSTGSVAWANITGKPYPVSSGQTWNWAPQGGQTWMWGTPDGNNMYPYNPANFSVNYATSAGGAPWGGISSPPAVTTWAWDWSGQPGQPSWLWGGNAYGTYYVYNPSNFNVNYANSANTANSATNANHATSADSATNATNATYANYWKVGCCTVALFSVGGSCHTGTPSYAECSTTHTFGVPAGWPADSAFNVMCTPTSSGGHPTIRQLFSTGNNSFYVTIFNGQANSDSWYDGLNCMAWHR